MKKWWNDIKKIEGFLFKQLPPRQHKPLEESLSLHQEAKDVVNDQATTYQAIRWYGRQKLRKNLKTLNRKLLHSTTEGALSREIKTLFKNQ